MLLLKNATVYPQTEKAPFMGDVPLILPMAVIAGL